MLASNRPDSSSSLITAGLTGGLAGVASTAAGNVAGQVASPATLALQQALMSASPAACYQGLTAATSLTTLQSNPQAQALAAEAPAIAAAVVRDVAGSMGLGQLVNVFFV